jgi:hypothetical protein
MERGSSGRSKAYFSNVGMEMLGSTKGGYNMMTSMIMADYLAGADKERQLKKELITRALEGQDRLLHSLQKDVGYMQDPEEKELISKVQSVARLVLTEKKIREKRQRQELERSQNLLNNLLQFSILMNTGASLGRH